MHPLIKNYLPLVDFLGYFLGPDTEVVLHDLDSKERSVVAIVNNHLSGREVGAPLTDFALKLIQEKAYEKNDFVPKYKGYLKNGEQACSSTFFIKTPEGLLVGMLCLNTDVSSWKKLEECMHSLTDNYLNFTSQAPSKDEENKETFSRSVEELMQSSIEKALAHHFLPPERLSQQEKMEVVATLYAEGFFQMRGAVENAAEALHISEPTVYRYLKKVQKLHS